ncbi:MAG: hybrid sensor histidine kinase/response regulator, partial [Nostoc sp.]
PTEIDLSITTQVQPLLEAEVIPPFIPTDTEVVSIFVWQPENIRENWTNDQALAQPTLRPFSAGSGQASSVTTAGIAAEFTNDVNAGNVTEENTIFARGNNPIDGRFSESKGEQASVSKEREIHENSVRVPSKQLEQIN